MGQDEFFVAENAAATSRAVPAMRLMREMDREFEPRWKRNLYLGVALVIATGYLSMLLCFWLPAHPGVDQNGYLVGGKMIADHFSTGFKPAEPYAHVGWMWVMTPDGWFYPKYPIGLPLINACLLWISWDQGKAWAFLVSPVCTSLALIGMFMLTRIAAGSFAGLLAMLVLGFSQITLQLANNPNSHASCLCCVVSGVFLLVRWWQTGSIWRGALAGFLCGYAVTIRYTDGLLAIPIAVAILGSMRWKQPRIWWRSLVPFFGWIVPVGVLIAFNWFAMKSLTGYDTTNESTGFSWKEFADKWEYMVQHLNNYALFLIAPMSVAGFAMMFRASWRMALILLLWFLPGTLLYTSYYWGQQRPGVSYLRFFLTLFPPMIVTALWMMQSAWRGAQPDVGRNRGSIAMPLGMGVVAAASCAIGAWIAVPNMERDHLANLNLAYTARQIARSIPMRADGKSVTPVVFNEGRRGIDQLVNYLQFVAEYEIYSGDAFSKGGRVGRGPSDPDQPNPLQPARQEYLKKILDSKTDKELVAEQNRIMSEAIRSGRGVYAILPPTESAAFIRRFVTANFQAKKLDEWKEPASVTIEARGGSLNPNSLGGANGRIVGAGPNRAAQSWQVWKITHKPPTSRPATTTRSQ